MNRYLRAKMMSGGDENKHHDRLYDHQNMASYTDQYLDRKPETNELTKEKAERWAAAMVNSDGSKGAHWNMDQTKQVMMQRGLDCDPVEFYAVMNAVYSDYAAVAKKHEVNNIDFYIDMAKAWMHDDDAMDGKAARYYQYIVKH